MAEETENTDRELWREREGDYYSDSIHITKEGGIGMNVGGMVIVMPIYEWHRFGRAAPDMLAALRQIAAGTEDREYPFRGAPREVLQRIARAAIDAAKVNGEPR